LLFVLAACRDGESSKTQPLAERIAPPLSREIEAEPSAEARAPTAAAAITGTVIETMNAGGYTYVQLDTGPNGEIWAAGSSTRVGVGDRVSIEGAMLMREFESKTLSRTFDEIYFANALRVVSRGSGATPAPTTESAPDAATSIDVEKLEDGYTVAEIFEDADALSGREVAVRGQVVRFSRAILDTNWLHIRDGTGSTGTDDLTVTTDDTATVGDVVVIRGRLSTNKDFGAGYTYPVIVEGASISE
jgi:hypothetical protein